VVPPPAYIDGLYETVYKRRVEFVYHVAHGCGYEDVLGLSMQIGERLDVLVLSQGKIFGAAVNCRAARFSEDPCRGEGEISSRPMFLF
jgi:hypothetical protein